MTDERQQAGGEYVLHLELDGDGPDVDSPIRTPSVDYYDSGVWVEDDRRRLFFPYERVVAIVEQPADASASDAAAAEEATLDAASAETPDTPVSSERDIE
ncbi:MAG: hypothetical protein ABEJ04_01445 [Halobacteriaceae archaeon]